ncbi:hypothetical protein [Parapusillimonas granuli]|nr:hypothetical protein [Parapusillimonas granuli]
MPIPIMRAYHVKSDSASEHKANEFIDIEQLEECERFLRRMAATL